MKYLPYLLTGVFNVLLSLQVSASENQALNTTSDDNPPLVPPVTLSEDHLHYVKLECEGFAKEDQIADEQKEQYIETCVSELSAAVESAIRNLQNPLEPQGINKNKTNSVKN